jgi:hypothetical protein
VRLSGTNHIFKDEKYCRGRHIAEVPKHAARKLEMLFGEAQILRRRIHDLSATRMKNPEANVVAAEPARREKTIEATVNDRACQVADFRGQDNAQLAVTMVKADLVEL